jgi:hypothetical protein
MGWCGTAHSGSRKVLREPRHNFCVWNPVGTNYVAESKAEGSNLLVSHRRKEGTHNMYILYVCIYIHIHIHMHITWCSNHFGCLDIYQAFWELYPAYYLPLVIAQLAGVIFQHHLEGLHIPLFCVCIPSCPYLSHKYATYISIFWLKHVETIRGFHSHRCDEALQIVWVFIGLPALRDWAMINTTHTRPHEEFQHQTEVKQR